MHKPLTVCLYTDVSTLSHSPKLNTCMKVLLFAKFIQFLPQAVISLISAGTVEEGGCRSKQCGLMCSCNVHINWPVNSSV